MMKTGVPLIDELPEITGEEFKFGIQAGSASAALKTPGVNPQEYKFGIEETGETYAFSDSPMARAMFGVKKAFPEDPGKATAVSMRMMALTELLHDEKASSKLEKWIRRPPTSSGDIHLHDSLLDVAAVAPLGKDTLFVQQQFFQLLAEKPEPGPGDWDSMNK